MSSNNDIIESPYHCLHCCNEIKHNQRSEEASAGPTNKLQKKLQLLWYSSETECIAYTEAQLMLYCFQLWICWLRFEQLLVGQWSYDL